jgi:cystathionine gamma-synthase
MPTREQQTLLAQLDHFTDPATGGVIPAIHPSTTYARGADYALPEHGGTYARDEDPTVAQVEGVLAKLEGGEEAMLFGSGLAGIAALFRAVAAQAALAGHKPRFVVQRSMYYGTVKLLESLSAGGMAEAIWFEPEKPGSLEAALAGGPADMVWIESPSNPYLNVIDIAATAEQAHGAGALLAIDSTVATPLLCQPLSLGADIVFHSATKAINGHSDVLAGLLVTRDAASALWQAIRLERKLGGAVLNSFGAWLLARGMRTMALRVERSCASAMKVAEALHAHDRVERVNYPGLPGDRGHMLAKRQMPGGFGALLSFHVTGGAEEALKLVENLGLIVAATSLGGPETLIEHRYTVEGPAYGAAPNLLRLSVGLEHPDDIIADLTQALARI